MLALGIGLCDTLCRADGWDGERGARRPDRGAIAASADGVGGNPRSNVGHGDGNRARRLRAEDRDEYQKWLVETAGQLKEMLDKGAAHDREAVSLCRELEEQGIDWRSFLVKVKDAVDFPQMMITNHGYHWWADQVGKFRPGREAELPGGVPNSAFFLNTEIGSYTPERIRAETEEIKPVGKITFTRAKKGGTSEGFFGKDERGREYIFVFDSPFSPEMNTSAEFIGSTLVRMAGYNIPRTSIVTVEGTGRPELDGRRAVATLAIKGFEQGYQFVTEREQPIGVLP